MNRRSFLKNSALALLGFTVLPPAETYQRIWKAVIVPAKMDYPPWGPIYSHVCEHPIKLTQEMVDNFEHLLWNTNRNTPVFGVDRYMMARRRLTATRNIRCSREHEPTQIP